MSEITQQEPQPTRSKWKEYGQETLQVFMIGWPLTVTFLCLTAMQFIDLIFIGRLHDSKYLESAALATAFTNCPIFLVLGTVHAQ